MPTIDWNDLYQPRIHHNALDVATAGKPDHVTTSLRPGSRNVNLSQFCRDYDGVEISHMKMLAEAKIEVCNDDLDHSKHFRDDNVILVEVEMFPKDV